MLETTSCCGTSFSILVPSVAHWRTTSTRPSTRPAGRRSRGVPRVRVVQPHWDEGEVPESDAAGVWPGALLIL